MANRDIVVVGASAGGVEALTELFAGVSADVAASFFVVLHLPTQGTSILPVILARATDLKVVHPDDGDPIERGHVYVAPPDHHLLVRRGSARVVHGPKENGHRPAIDPLFRTAAFSYGARVIGVVLSGSLDDGSAGMSLIRSRGGVGVAQDPEEAAYPGMPQNAIDQAGVDYVAPVTELRRLVVRLVEEPQAEEVGITDEDLEPDSTEVDRIAPPRPMAGAPAGFTCPECHGALWEYPEGDVTRYQCVVGHIYSPESLIDGQSDALEAALWAALRALEESASLMSRLAGRMAHRGHTRTAERYAAQARETEERAALVRGVLLNREQPVEPVSGGQEASGELGEDRDGESRTGS